MGRHPGVSAQLRSRISTSPTSIGDRSESLTQYVVCRKIGFGIRQKRIFAASWKDWWSLWHPCHLAHTWRRPRSNGRTRRNVVRARQLRGFRDISRTFGSSRLRGVVGSATGTSWTCRSIRRMSAFVDEGDVVSAAVRCPPMTQVGHRSELEYPQVRSICNRTADRRATSANFLRHRQLC